MLLGMVGGAPPNRTFSAPPSRKLLTTNPLSAPRSYGFIAGFEVEPGAVVAPADFVVERLGGPSRFPGTADADRGSAA